MLKLYGGARSRATIVQWGLEELEVPYEFVLLDMQTGEHRQPAFLSINPMGKVPAIVDGDLKLWESGAILLYLAEKYDPSPISPEQRAELTQWVMFTNATLGPNIFAEASRDREILNLFPPLNQLLEQQPFLMGDRFTMADVAVGSVLYYMTLMLKLEFTDYPAIAAYLQRLSTRPAHEKVFAA
jgi:glutathione S-transferase